MIKMGVYIKSMEMPKGKPICIIIDYAGQVRRYDLYNDRYADDELFEANQIPDHGDLIDCNALTISMAVPIDGKPYQYIHIDNIKAAPIVIPADKAEDGE